jgi:hypothetical protein
MEHHRRSVQPGRHQPASPSFLANPSPRNDSPHSVSSRSRLVVVVGRMATGRATDGSATPTSRLERTTCRPARRLAVHPGGKPARQPEPSASICLACRDLRGRKTAAGGVPWQPHSQHSLLLPAPSARHAGLDCFRWLTLRDHDDSSLARSPRRQSPGAVSFGTSVAAAPLLDNTAWLQARCCLECGGKCRDGVSGGLRLTDQAARSMTASVGLVASVCQPSTFRMVICPQASSAQNSIAAVSGDGRTVWVLIRRLNSSCSRSTAFVVRADRRRGSGACPPCRLQLAAILQPSTRRQSSSQVRSSRLMAGIIQRLHLPDRAHHVIK